MQTSEVLKVFNVAIYITLHVHKESIPAVLPETLPLSIVLL